MQRSDASERLDGPLLDAAVLRGNLRDLERVNRWLGGTALSRRAIERLAGDRSAVEVLDVGTGAADIPIALLGEDGPVQRVVGLDSRPEILEQAVARRPELARTPGLTLQLGDGRSLPFADDAFDIVHASLVIHHLPPDDVVALLAEMRRVARLGVVVNDLLRGRLGHTGAWLLARLATGNEYTRHDAPLSVRRAYTLPELEALLAGAGMHVAGRWFGLARHRVALAARVPR
jgi:SAM-dependent methyltransferase